MESVKTVFIPKTDKRYSISSNGIVFCNYRFSNNGQKFYKKAVVKKYLLNKVSKTACVSLQIGKWSASNRMKAFYLNTLMEKCFNLRPPDKFHFYDLRFKDGDCFNVSLNNLEYRIRMETDSKYRFYPKPIYNQRGKIIRKICACCGAEKDIDAFQLQAPKEEGQNKTYRNICEKCRSSIQWKTVKSNPERFARNKRHVEKWAKSKEGQKYYKKYRRVYCKNQVETLHPHYIASCLRIRQSELTPTLLQISRKKILLSRTIKPLKKQAA